jgi:hypothetical protein
MIIHNSRGEAEEAEKSNKKVKFAAEDGKEVEGKI